MTPSFAACAILVLGQCGYTPEEIKKRIPLYEINQILHANMVKEGVVMEWAHYQPDESLNAAFEELKEQWRSAQQFE